MSVDNSFDRYLAMDQYRAPESDEVVSGDTSTMSEKDHPVKGEEDGDVSSKENMQHRRSSSVNIRKIQKTFQKEAE
ncbi:kinesin-like protein NACK1 [Artemisia annua]|uniref:Kinesin-like protein NACK1 n=1 Tax=Artemisia annua TaxID=35608 RepID=A0A2U1M734_ARTAN|nr:kinesin-like protein NACK1 [Artemisia annua]